MHAIEPIAMIRRSSHHCLIIVEKHFKGLSYIKSSIFPLSYGRLPCVGGAVMKEETIRVTRFQQTWNSFTYFCQKFICIIMVKSILEDKLTYGWIIFKESDKKHAALRVVIHFEGYFLF